MMILGHSRSASRFGQVLVTGTLTVIFGIGLFAQAGRGQEKPLVLANPPVQNDGEMHMVAYSLRFASAESVKPVLSALLLGNGGTARFEVDVRTNRVIIQATPKDHERASILLKTLDEQVNEPQLLIIPSKDRGVAIRALLEQLGVDVQIAVDPDLGTLILKGNKADVERTAALVTELEPLLARKPGQPGHPQFNVEVFCLASENGKSDSNVPADAGLEVVLAALKKKGVANPILLSRSSIVTLGDTPFAAKDELNFEVAGTVSKATNGVLLEIDVDLPAQDRKVSFRTTIATELGHPIVFASTQPQSKDSRSFYFVVRVNGE